MLTKRGFTLVELLVAISIVTILSTVGLVTYTQAQANARDGKRISDIQEIQKALEQYYAVNGQYPRCQDATGYVDCANVVISWVNDDTASFSSDITELKNLNDYFIAKKIPRDSKSYYYDTCSSSKKYALCVSLENCQGKCNRYTIFSDKGQRPCQSLIYVKDGYNPNYYCIGNVLN